MEEKTRRTHVFSPHDVYCGRPSKFGNPFSIGKDGTRSECIEKYRNWVVTQEELMKDIAELKGLRLSCWCNDGESCHVDVIVEMVEKMENKKKVEIFFEDDVTQE